MSQRFETDQWAPMDVGTRLIRAFAWLAKAKCTHGALVVVSNRDGGLLLVQERFRERGSWGFPGGFLRRRESPGQAAVRELAEEVGLVVAEPELQLIAEYHQPWAHHYDHLFALRLDNTPTSLGGKSREVRGHAWFAPDRLPPLTRPAQYALGRGEFATTP
jgi:ADP-ribose pyrophosphatase YjhB (NUDIX family)